MAISDILSSFDRTLWLVTAAHRRRRGGLIATFVSSASLVPSLPRMAVGLAKHHHTTSLVRQSGAFCLHLMSEADLDLVWHFALQSGHDVDKFATQPWSPRETGSPVLDRLPAWLDCRVEAVLDIGDRMLFVGEVVAGGEHTEPPPLTQRRLLSLAPRNRLEAMADHVDRDIDLDAPAILHWRQTRRRPERSTRSR
jgi:flavin reductase (DIM6/NTAB) family NADH-FMN oxidoreductase RutF